MNLTIKVKLLPTPEQAKALLETMEAFNNACNYISQVAFKERTFGQVGIHHLVYRQVRDQFGLSAQLTVRAMGKVSESYKINRSHLHIFKKHSAIVYDKRILSFRGLDTVSILSIKGRYKIPIVFGSYAKLEERKVRGQADLIYKHGMFFLCLVVELPDGTPIKPTGILGVDMGIVNLATSSDGEVFSGKAVDAVRIRLTKLKARLQSKGTKSAKRHLKKFSGKERRFKSNTNHCISKKIVLCAKDTCRSISLENLKGFNGRQTVRKAQRERFGKWAFDELRRFIEYKAKLLGVPVEVVNPRNTSRMCSACGHVAKSNRKSQSLFVCGKCGFTTNADFNASQNIAARAAVNRPIVDGILSIRPQNVSPICKPRTLVRGG